MSGPRSRRRASLRSNSNFPRISSRPVVAGKNLHDRLTAGARKAGASPRTAPCSSSFENYFAAVRAVERENQPHRVQPGGSERRSHRQAARRAAGGSEAPSGARRHAHRHRVGQRLASNSASTGCAGLALTLVEAKTRKAVFLVEALRHLNLPTARLRRPASSSSSRVQSFMRLRSAVNSGRSGRGTNASDPPGVPAPGRPALLVPWPQRTRHSRREHLPARWTATYPLVESLRSRLVVLTKEPARK